MARWKTRARSATGVVLREEMGWKGRHVSTKELGGYCRMLLAPLTSTMLEARAAREDVFSVTWRVFLRVDSWRYADLI